MQFRERYAVTRIFSKSRNRENFLLSSIQLLFIAFSLTILLTPNKARASNIYYWAAYIVSHPAGLEPKRFPDYKSACDSLRKTIYWYESRVYKQTASNNYYCYIWDSINRHNEYIGQANGKTLSCPNGHTGLTCNATLPACPHGSYDPVSSKCVVASENGSSSQPCSIFGDASGVYNPEPERTVGNPVNFITGNKFHQEVYFSSRQSSGVLFQRYYNSSDAIWRHSYSDRLIFQVDQIKLSLADGKTLIFLLSGAPKNPESAAHGELKAMGNGWQYLAKNQIVYSFDSQGRLVKLQLPAGSAHNLSYISTTTGTQVFVEDVFGNRINFKQNAAGGLYELATAGMAMRFTHNANGQLIRVTKTIGDKQISRQYHYEDPNNLLNLTGVTDENGIRYATWAYDVQGRAISSQHAGGADKVLISYNADGSTSVINELGKRTTYRFLTIDGSKKISAIEGEPSANCPNSNSSFTYDERGLLKTKTDNKGHLTTYEYNTRGLEISRTEASGTPQARTITTEWHPTMFLPLTVSEPGRTITYTYDAQGRQLSRSSRNADL